MFLSAETDTERPEMYEPSVGEGRLLSILNSQHHKRGQGAVSFLSMSLFFFPSLSHWSLLHLYDAFNLILGCLSRPHESRELREHASCLGRRDDSFCCYVSKKKKHLSGVTRADVGLISNSFFSKNNALFCVTACDSWDRKPAISSGTYVGSVLTLKLPSF